LFSIITNLLHFGMFTCTVRAGSGSAILLPFSNRGHPFAKVGPTPFMREWSSVKAAVWPVPAATGESATDRSRASAVIIDFAQARKSRHAPRIREEASNERQRRIALTDVVAIVYALMATAFYPALAWFLSIPEDLSKPDCEFSKRDGAGREVHGA
jgi:hypothetical protein